MDDLTFGQAGEHLGLTGRTIDELVRRGELTIVRRGSVYPWERWLGRADINRLYALATAPIKRVQRKHIPAQPGIYAICNLLNGRVYVGSSVNMRLRTSSHFRYGVNYQIAADLAVMGREAFEFMALQIIEDRAWLGPLETEWLERCRAAYGPLMYNEMPAAYR